MDTSKIVGEKIKALREDKSISIEELAQRSGLAIEHSKKGMFSARKSLACLFDMDCMYISLSCWLNLSAYKSDK